MSLWGVHMGLAGIVTAVVLLAVAPGYRYRGTVIGVSMLWAVVPDFHHALGSVPRLQAGWKAVLHESALTNLFWFHRLIDRAEPGDSPLLSAAMWLVFGGVLVGIELVIRRHRGRERQGSG